MDHLIDDKTEVVLRGVFLIDPERKIHFSAYSPFELGRKTAKMLRCLRVAYQTRARVPSLVGGA